MSYTSSWFMDGAMYEACMIHGWGIDDSWMCETIWKYRRPLLYNQPLYDTDAAALKPCKQWSD